MPDENLDHILERIAVECEEAGASQWDTIKVLNELKHEFSAIEDMHSLRKRAIEILKEINPKASETYASFERLKVYTSKQFVEPFDRGNIVKSLLRETSIPRALAEKIGSEVEEEIKDLKINYLNTALIRALADVKLLQYGREDIHWQYTRAGLPLYEIKKRISKEPFKNKELLTEYMLFNFLPKELVDMHFNADLHISSLEDFATAFRSILLTPSKQNSLSLFISSMLNEINENHMHSSKQVNIHELNIAVSGLLEGRKKNAIKETAAILCNFLDSVYSGNEDVSVGMSLFFPDNFSKELKDKSVLFTNEFLREYKKNPKNFTLAISLENQFELKLLDDKFLNSLKFMNCKNRCLFNMNNVYSEKKGILMQLGMNLPKTAFTNRKNEHSFFNEIEKILVKINEVYALKKETLAKRDYLEKYNLNDFSPVLGLHGLFFSSKELLSRDFVDKDVIDFSERIISFIKHKLGKEWVITRFNDSEGVKRFNEYNRNNFTLRPHPDSTKGYLRASKEFRKDYLMPCIIRDKKEIADLIKDDIRIVSLER